MIDVNHLIENIVKIQDFQFLKKITQIKMLFHLI